MRKRYLLLIILAIFTFGFTNVLAFEISDDVITGGNETSGVSEYTPKINDNNYTYTNEDNNFTARIDDGANLLNSYQRSRLLDEIKPLTKYGHMTFVTVESPISVNSYASAYYQKYYGYSNGVLFLINTTKNEMLIYAGGSTYRSITSTEKETIMNNISYYSEHKLYYNCASTVFKEVSLILAEQFKDTGDYNYTNAETNFTAKIDDGANLLTSEQRAKLFEEIKPLTQYGHIAFITTASNSTSVDSFASTYYHSAYGTESGTIFIIDMTNRKIYIFSDGSNYRSITRSKALSITDNTYRYATREEYYECASLSFKQISTVLSGGKIAEPMRYTSNVFVALSLAFLLSFLYILGKSKMEKASVKSIVDNCDIEFQIGETSAIKTGQHRVYSPQSSGGSGGGGGGGGGSGGGGGHGF